MDIAGPKLIPRTLEFFSKSLTLLVIGITFPLITFAPINSLLIVIFLFTTGWWHVTVLYLCWIWFIDTKICEQGARRSEWVRSSKIWDHFKNYFPITVVKTHDLNPSKNYLFCCFPHGFLATGVVTAFGTNACGVQEVFPQHKPHVLTLKSNFSIPFLRDYFLSLGSCAASSESISWLMGAPRGGNIAVLVVGGAAESFYCRPGNYHLILKNRKGFVRQALKNGCPLVPVFSFGETDIFDQLLPNKKGSVTRCLQEKVKKITGVAPIFPSGRGFALVPKREPINIIVGKPIDVEKIENPTQEQIDELHQRFITDLIQLYDDHKVKYSRHPHRNIIIQ